MNTIPCCRFPYAIGPATATVLGSEFEAQLEAIAFGITANQAALAD